MTDLPHLLVVDDDARLRELLRRYLSDQGFRVTVAADAAEARARLEAFAFDLIVLDIMLPGENGYDLTAALRRHSRVPILLLSALGEAEDRIAGLERGADDYLAKPFEPRELVLRIRTILRRVPQEAPPPVRRVRFGPHSFDLDRRILRRGEEEIRLTTAEADLLSMLAQSPGVPMSREELSRQSGPGSNSRTVDVQMTRLRRKIEADPRFPRYLQTVRGRGYMLVAD
ncbi:MAG: response regulator transcription factor [Rhodospirillaceae bacterium]|nr:response regulator transcription factor [Rhodospirillaceae bacterium]